MFPLEQYRADALRLDADPFAELYAPYFLVHTARGKTGWGEDMEWQTVIAKRPPPPDSGPPNSWAVALRKRPGNPHPNQLSVGRARSNDITIRYSCVSKLHAHLVLEGAEVAIRDLGSSNGTLVNGAPLERMALRSLKTGDQISFGQLDVRLTTAHALHARLRAALPPPSSSVFDGDGM